MKYKWKISGFQQFWKDEFIQIRPSEDGVSLAEILSSLERELSREDKISSTYLLEIPKELVKECKSIQEEVLIITPRRYFQHENGDFSFIWHLNIFKNYRPYRDWFSSKTKCITDSKYQKTSALEFEELMYSFLRSLALKSFN